MNTEKMRSIFAISLIVVLTVALVITLWPFINAFFGALILYVIFLPLYNYFIKKKIRKGFSAILVIIVSILIIIIPLSIVLSLVAGQVYQISKNPEVIVNVFDFLQKLIPGVDISQFVYNYVPGVGNFLGNLIFNFIGSTGKLFVILLIMYFTLYYLLVKEKPISKELAWIIPFNKKNTDELIQEFKNMTYTIIVVTGIIALVQGLLLTASFLLFGVGHAILWGFIGAVLSFLPVVGPAIIWIPVCLFKFATKEYKSGIGILVFGVVLSSIDNFIRPYLQEKVGKIHPLITLIGVFVGIPAFGLLGVIIGPLLISYVMLTLKMFREEYLKD